MSDMTQSFIEMVEAYKAKPELEAQIKALGEDNALCYQTIDLKNSNIATLNAELAELRTKLAEVTKERDDASFRNLELDEKLSGIEKFLGVAERLEQARKQEHQATIDAMTPKSEPVPVPLFGTEPSQDAGIPVSMGGGGGPVEVEGQSATNPTKASSLTENIGTATAIERPINPYTGFPIHYPDGEYKGMDYYNKPSWVSWAAFVDAGGEAEPYMKNFG